jgi:hypothetical protein
MSREVFKQSIGYLLEVVAAIKPDQWEQNAIGNWCVRDLVGHASRSMGRIEEHAAASPVEPTGVDVTTSSDDRGFVAGKALGNDPLATLKTLADRVLPLVDSLPQDYMLDLPQGRRSIDDYMSSRVQEVTVHTMDIAAAIGLDIQPPSECLRESLYYHADRAIERNQAVELVLALTGRAPLPEGFNLVGPQG